jgi:uncharacterized membrane protein
MKRVYDLANLVLVFLTALFVNASYHRLPERIPMHFDMAGRPDRWSGRGGIVMLVVIPFVLTGIFYVLIRLIPRLGTNPRYLNIPRKAEFLRLPAEKQDVYWALYKEFFAALAATLNLLFYLIIRATVRIATGELSLLPLRAVLPALVFMALIMVFYVRRLFVLPARLIRGDE